MKKPSKALLRQWYAKLKRDGFVDAETQFRNGEMILKQYHASLQFRVTAEQFRQRQDYYDLATSFLHTYQFASAQDKAIWALFADGISEQRIYKQLKLTRACVNSTLRRLRKACYGSAYPTASGIR